MAKFGSSDLSTLKNSANIKSVKIAKERSHNNSKIKELELDVDFTQILFLDGSDEHVNQNPERFWELFQNFVKLQKELSLKIDLSYLVFPHDEDNILQKTLHKNDVSFNFNYCIFNESVDLSGIKIKQEISFEHAIFKKNTNFGYTTFFKNSFFSNISFEGNTYFTASAFITIVDFQNSECKKIFDFSDVSFTLLNLDKSYFPHASYLRLNGWDDNKYLERVVLSDKHFETKETARIIKVHFEKQNNITESNIYFPIEMEKYRKEIAYKDINSFLNFFLNKNYFVTTVSKYVSNFGTDWVRVLGWIILFSITILILHDGFPSNKETLLNIPNRAMELINPLNVFKKDYDLYKGHEFLAMIVRIITVYLFWQFTMAFRQNTRRK